jgi:Glycosyl hydrolases family 16
VAMISVIVSSISVQLPVVAQAQSSRARVSPLNVNGSYPVGTPNNAEPSGMSLPTRQSLAGFSLIYQNDFLGTKVPPGWNVFTGIPGGDPGGHFGISHVVVSNGVLQLNTYRNPAWHNRWVTGGICQCGAARRYGAYFVRSRITGAGPTAVELLWPANNAWPPEIDFNETGGSATSTTSSVHFGATNNVVRSNVKVNMTLWHTWGVIWTPHYILYTLDGRLWGQFRVAADIASVPMTLDFEQRQECQRHRQCPTAPESMQIDWVAEYAQR